MVCLGLKPRVAGWLVQTNSQSYVQWYFPLQSKGVFSGLILNQKNIIF